MGTLERGEQLLEAEEMWKSEGDGSDTIAVSEKTPPRLEGSYILMQSLCNEVSSQTLIFLHFSEMSCIVCYLRTMCRN